MKAVKLGDDAQGPIFGVRFRLDSPNGRVEVTMPMGDASRMYMALGCAVADCVRKYHAEGVGIGAGAETMQVAIAELARAHEADEQCERRVQ